METNLLLILIAAACAFAAVYAASWVAAASFTRKRTAIAAQGEKATLSGFVRWRLRNGYAVLIPTAARILQMKRVADCVQEALVSCEARGIASTRESLLSVFMMILLVVGVAVGVVMRSPLGAIAVCVCLTVISIVVAGSARDKREEAVREAVPGALEAMSACFGSGFTLLQTFRQVAQETPGYLGRAFLRSAHVLETGGSAKQALDALREGAHATDLAFVAVALEVQHQSGGSIRQVLEAASDSVKGELQLRRSLRVQTAQAKLSARIVVVMPFILVAVFSLVSPDFLTPFFASPLGYAMLALAIVMQVAGVVLVHRALSVDGVS